jgi:hypothetical protein
MLTETKMDDCAALRAAYRAARAAVDRLMEEEAPEGVIFDRATDTEVGARDALKAARCANAEDFFANAKCAHEIIGHDLVEWRETAAAMLENYLERRRA